MTSISEDSFVDSPPCLTFTDDTSDNEKPWSKPKKSALTSKNTKISPYNNSNSCHTNTKSTSAKINTTTAKHKKTANGSAFYDPSKLKKKQAKQTQFQKNNQYDNANAIKSRKQHLKTQLVSDQYPSPQSQSFRIPKAYSEQPYSIQNFQTQQPTPSFEPTEIPWVFKALGSIWDNGRKIFAPPQVAPIQESVEPAELLPGALSPDCLGISTPLAPNNSEGGYLSEMMADEPVTPTVAQQPEYYNQYNQYHQQQIPEYSEYVENSYSTESYPNWTPSYTNPGYSNNGIREMPSPGKLGFSRTPVYSQEFSEEFEGPELVGSQYGTEFLVQEVEANSSPFGKLSSIDFRAFLIPVAIFAFSLTTLLITSESEPSNNLVQRVAGFINTIMRGCSVVAMFCSLLYISYKYLTLPSHKTFVNQPISQPGQQQQQDSNGNVFIAGQALEEDPFYLQTLQQAEEMARVEVERMKNREFTAQQQQLYSGIGIAAQPALMPVETPNNPYTDAYTPPQVTDPSSTMPQYYMPSNYVSAASHQPYYVSQNMASQTADLMEGAANKYTPNSDNSEPQTFDQSMLSKDTSPLAGENLLNTSFPLPMSSPKRTIPHALQTAEHIATTLSQQKSPNSATVASPTTATDTSATQEHLNIVNSKPSGPEGQETVNPIPQAAGFSYPSGYMIPNYTTDSDAHDSSSPTALSDNDGHVYNYSFLPAGTSLNDDDDDENEGHTQNIHNWPATPIMVEPEVRRSEEAKDRKKKKSSMHVLDLAKDENFRQEIMYEMEASSNGKFLSMPALPSVDYIDDDGDNDNSSNSYKPATAATTKRRVSRKSVNDRSSGLGADSQKLFESFGPFGNKPNSDKTSGIANQRQSKPGVFGTPYNNMEISRLESAIEKASQKKNSADEEKRGVEKKADEKKTKATLKAKEQKGKEDNVESNYFVDQFACKPYGPPPKRYRGVKS